MPHVLNHNYSNFYDHVADRQFLPVLDQRIGCYVAHAEVADEEAARYENRPHFEVLSADEFASVLTQPKAPEPMAPTTGDPLTDAAQAPAQKRGRKASKLSVPAPPPLPDAK